MPEYLSDAWVGALDEALRHAPGVVGMGDFVIEQVVRDVPGRGVVRYRISIDARGGHAGSADAETDGPADLRLTTDYATAARIARGIENAQQALAHGRLRVGGNLDVLARHAGALATLDDATAELRASTTYDDDHDGTP